jgi:bifunctional DNA-binding transcriptional regulator/antitoxin component of YhaV-PrlF toxin-antitoxin module
MAANLTVGREGEIALPTDVRERYGIQPDTPIRVVETRTGILLVPLTGAPMSEALQQELAEWQEASLGSWDLFPYDALSSRAAR